MIILVTVILRDYSFRPCPDAQMANAVLPPTKDMSEEKEEFFNVSIGTMLDSFISLAMIFIIEKAKISVISIIRY